MQMICLAVLFFSFSHFSQRLCRDFRPRFGRNQSSVMTLKVFIGGLNFSNWCDEGRAWLICHTRFPIEQIRSWRHETLSYREATLTVILI